MSFAEVMGRQQAAIFRVLGEDAAWTGIVAPVRVVRRETDEIQAMNRGAAAIIRTRFIFVRKTEVETPAKGDRITTEGGVFEVIAEPLLDRRSRWSCQVALR